MERCPQCGNPRYVCGNDDDDIDFRVYEDTCYAVKKKQRHEAKLKSDKGREGIAVGIEAYTHSDTPMTDFRSPYYQLKAGQREEIEKLRPRRAREHPPGWTPSDEEIATLDSAP